MSRSVWNAHQLSRELAVRERGQHTPDTQAGLTKGAAVSNICTECHDFRCEPAGRALGFHACRMPHFTLGADAFDELKRRSEEPGRATPAMVELLRSTRGKIKHASDKGQP